MDLAEIRADVERYRRKPGGVIWTDAERNADALLAEVDRLTAERDEARQYRDVLLKARADVDRALDAAVAAAEVDPTLVEAAASEGGQAGVIGLLTAERDRAIGGLLRLTGGA